MGSLWLFPETAGGSDTDRAVNVQGMYADEAIRELQRENARLTKQLQRERERAADAERQAAYMREHYVPKGAIERRERIA